MKRIVCRSVFHVTCFNGQYCSRVWRPIQCEANIPTAFLEGGSENFRIVKFCFACELNFDPALCSTLFVFCEGSCHRESTGRQDVLAGSLATGFTNMYWVEITDHGNHHSSTFSTICAVEET